MFEFGDLVDKSSGYAFSGMIRAVFYTRAGKLRYVVEHETSEGLLHIFNGDQLVGKSPPRPTPDNQGGA